MTQFLKKGNPNNIGRQIQYILGQLKKLKTNTSTEPTDSRPYKVYTALLNQTGTNAPVATILENTLGFIPQWSYNSVGNYFSDNEEWFTMNIDKVAVFINTAFSSSRVTSIASFNTEDFPGFISIKTYNSGGSEANDILSNNDLPFIFTKTTIEIRVYN